MAVHEFDSTLQKSNTWIKELGGELQVSEHQAYQALKGVLQEVRDRLPVYEIANFGSQLPMLIRGLYFEGWKPSEVPLKFSKEEFMDRVHSHLQYADNIAPDTVVSQVFAFLARKVSEGEMKDIKESMPKQIKELFPF